MSSALRPIKAPMLLRGRPDRPSIRPSRTPGGRTPHGPWPWSRSARTPLPLHMPADLAAIGETEIREIGDEAGRGLLSARV